jgi:predicted dehydrogenase
MGVHVMDCLEFYFGEMENMQGIVENKGGYYEADDTVVATFKFKNGIIGSGTWCYVADQEINEVQIVGEKGRIVYDGLGADNFKLIKDGIETIYEFEVPEHIAMPYQQAVVNELLGLEKCHCNFQEAINVVDMTDRLLKSFYERGNENVEN